MEGLIFTIPVLLVFLFFFIQIFLLFKKVFAYIFKNISELNQEITNNYNPAQSKDENKNEYLFKQTLEKPEEDYIPIAERDINEINNNSHEKDKNKKDSAVNVQSEMQKSKDNIRKNNKNEDIKKYKNIKNNSSVSVFNFDNLNELEKAVIVKEILDKPRALR